MVFPLGFVHGPIHLGEESLGVFPLQQGGAHGYGEPEGNLPGAVEGLDAVVNPADLIFQLLGLAAGEKDDKLIPRHAQGNGILQQGLGEKTAQLGDCPVSHGVAVAVVDGLEVVYVHHNALQPDFLPDCPGQIVIQVLPVQQPGGGVHIGAAGLHLQIDAQEGNGGGHPAGGQTVEKPLEYGAHNAGGHEAVHREEEQGDALPLGVPHGGNALGVVAEHGDVHHQIQAPPDIPVVRGDGENHPAAKQVGQQQRIYHHQGNPQHFCFDFLLPDVEMDAKIHIQAPQEAHGDCHAGADGIGEKLQEAPPGENVAVNEKAHRLRHQGGQGAHQHGREHPLPQPVVLIPPEAVEKQEKHHGNSAAIGYQNLRNIHAHGLQSPVLSSDILLPTHRFVN